MSETLPAQNLNVPENGPMTAPPPTMQTQPGNQRPQQRRMDKRIYKTEMKFWAGLGSWGCSDLKTPKSTQYATFWGDFFNFLWAKIKK